MSEPMEEEAYICICAGCGWQFVSRNKRAVVCSECQAEGQDAPPAIVPLDSQQQP